MTQKHQATCNLVFSFVWKRQQPRQERGFNSVRFEEVWVRGGAWLRHYSPSQKVAGSIPDCIIVISHLHNPYSRIMALGSTQPLTQKSTRVTSLGGKGGRRVWLTTVPPSCADCLEILGA